MYLGKLRVAMRTGIIQREGHDGVNLRKLPLQQSAFYMQGSDKAGVECGSEVDILDESTTSGGVTYLLINQFKISLPDGTTPHGWINAAYCDV